MRSTPRTSPLSQTAPVRAAAVAVAAAVAAQARRHRRRLPRERDGRQVDFNGASTVFWHIVEPPRRGHVMRMTPLVIAILLSVSGSAVAQEEWEEYVNTQ